jgi:hypothetical protein
MSCKPGTGDFVPKCVFKTALSQITPVLCRHVLQAVSLEHARVCVCVFFAFLVVLLHYQGIGVDSLCCVLSH